MWDIVWLAPRMHRWRSLSAGLQSLWQALQCPWFVLKRFEVHHCFLGRPNPGGRIVGPWTKSRLATEAKLKSSCHWEVMSTGSMSDHRGMMLADVEVDEGGHYWGAVHRTQLLWPPLLLCASKKVVQYGLKQEAMATVLADVEVGEGGHYWGAMHGTQLLWQPVCPLLLCASKQVVQYGLKQEAMATVLAGEYQI